MSKKPAPSEPVLSVTPETEGLKRTNQSLKQEKQTLQKKLRDAEQLLKQKDTQKIKLEEQLRIQQQEQKKHHKSFQLKLSEAKKKQTVQIMEHQIETAFLACGGRKEALPDVLARANGYVHSSLKDRQAKANPEEWVAIELRHTAPHLFIQSNGAASHMGSVPNQNPFDVSRLTLSEQARLKKQYPTMAKLLQS